MPLPSASAWYGQEQYFGEDEDYMINPATLDIEEKTELIRNNKTKIYDLQQTIEEQRLAQQQAEEIARKQQEDQKNQPQVVTTKAAV